MGPVEKSLSAEVSVERWYRTESNKTGEYEMALELRSLTGEEISDLVKQGCSCDDWSKGARCRGFHA